MRVNRLAPNFWVETIQHTPSQRGSNSLSVTVNLKADVVIRCASETCVSNYIKFHIYAPLSSSSHKRSCSCNWYGS